MGAHQEHCVCGWTNPSIPWLSSERSGIQGHGEHLQPGRTTVIVTLMGPVSSRLEDQVRVGWLVGFLQDVVPTLGGVAQWIESWPANQKVTGLIPSQGTCLGCRPDAR